METPTWTAYAAACLATLSLFLLTKYLRQRKLNLPPGPKPWPIIGNLTSLAPSLTALSTNSPSSMGPFCNSASGLFFAVVVGLSAEMAKVFLKSMDFNFVDRPKMAAGKYTTYNYSNITWSSYGPYWRQARKMCLMELFTAKRLESLEYIRTEELQSLLHDLYNLTGKPILLKDYLMKIEIISRMVLGKRYLDESKNSIVTPEEFKKMLDELFLLNGVLNIGDYIPWIDFMDLQGYVKRMKVLSNKFDRETWSQGFHPGLVGWWNREFSSDRGMHKATEELDRVIGQNRWVQEKDIPNLPYIEAIVKETMRLHPVAPMLTPRLCGEDCKVAGYDILKGTRVLVSVWTIARDPTLWDEPEAFKPERFLGNSIDVKGHNFELLPFGAGRRMCPGYNLGLKVIQASLANLLHGFKWSLPDNMTPEDLNMEEIFGLSIPKKIPLAAVIKPRLAPNVYSA
ncbi:cytochrome p450 98a1 [Nicotiana attenuata]|uniref:Cytochrome p450 98a1 n=1 Tax=Nicotiana attenuata TaxID=49451 RepID=A0A1J6IN52_NICAT|nr:cytochrome p450 98a1 [Nicotiana attenuata]